MNNFLLIVCWTFMLRIIFSIIRPYRKEKILGCTEIRTNWLGAILMMAPIICWATTRSDIFGDTSTYYGNLERLPLEGFGEFLASDLKDKGFYILTYILKRIAGTDRYFYFGVIALFQGICVMSVYRKYSSDYWLSMLLFILSTDFLAWMFNGMRQFIAVAMLFACIGLILRKKYVPIIFVILVASTIHQSALLMLPVLFVVQGRPFNKRVVFFSVLLIFAILWLDRTTNLVENMLLNTQYADLATNIDTILMEDDGANILRVMVYAIPTILAIIGRKYVLAADDPVINLSVNMSCISTGFYVLAIFTSGIYIGRLPIYFSLYNYILLPWLIKNMFTRDSQRMIRTVLYAAYIVFYYYQVHITWRLI